MIFGEVRPVDGNLIWYYLQNGKSIGPFSKDQIVQLANSGSISKDCLVWSVSQNQEWKRLEEVFNLTEELPPPLPNSLFTTSTISISELEQKPHPWRRYLARVLDNTVNGGVMWVSIGILLAAVAPTKSQEFFSFISDPKYKFVDIFLTCLIAPFANAAFIGFTGSSLGKWFFGVRVMDQRKRAVGYKIALKREFLVWVYGLGCGIPLINIGAILLQRSNLDKNKITPWDKDLNLVVSYRKNGVLQYALSTMGFALFFFIYAVLAKL